MAKELIKVYITTYQVPFDTTVDAVGQFTTETAAVTFINQLAAKWYSEHNGPASDVADAKANTINDWPYAPITELGYDNAHFALWGGECGFHAVLDKATYARLNEAHYKREFTDKGQELPGYLQVAKVQGTWPE